MSAARTISLETHGEDETINLAKRLGTQLMPGDVVALVGELGAGKTRFVRGLAMGLGLDAAQVNSPTFVLVNVYTDRDGATRLFHLDAYRLSSADELAELGWDQIFDDSAVVAIEWAERVKRDLPDSCIDILIEHTGDGQTRCIHITPPTGRELDLSP